MVNPRTTPMCSKVYGKRQVVKWGIKQTTFQLQNSVANYCLVFGRVPLVQCTLPSITVARVLQARRTAREALASYVEPMGQRDVV